MTTTTPRPFAWESLPRISAATAEGTKFCARIGSAEGFDSAMRTVEETLEALGFECTGLRLSRVDDHPDSMFASPAGASVATELEVPGVRGRGAVVVDSYAARRLVDVLAGAAESDDSPVDDWEFGLVSYAFARVAHRLREQGMPSVVFGTRRRPVELLAELVGGSGPVREFGFEFELPTAGAVVTAWLTIFAPATMVAALAERARTPLDLRAVRGSAVADVSVWLQIGVGRTALTVDEFHGLGRGDVVFFDGHALEDQEHVATAAGRLFLRKGTWLDVDVAPSRRWSVAINDTRIRRAGATMQEPEETAATTQLVEQPWVELEAVVGRVELTLDELARLRPGEVLTTDRAVSEPVDLVVSGTLVGRGELVDVEGRLGVRVLSLQRR